MRLLPVDRQKLAVGLALTASGLIAGYLGVWGTSACVLLGLWLTWDSL